MKASSLTLYSNKLDIKKFENLLSHNDQGYKFFWLEAIMRLIPNKHEMYTFEEVIDEMIWGAWSTVTHYHLRLGHNVNGNVENFLEHSIRILYEEVKGDLGNKTPSRERLISLIYKYNEKLLPDKVHLTDYVPYRLIKPFVDKEGKEYIDRKNYGRFISYLNAFAKQDNEFFYDIFEAENPLKRQIRINPEWREFMMQNYSVIKGWIRYNKAIYIQDKNPGVPGVMMKIAPEVKNGRKSLEAVRNLWKMVSYMMGHPLYEIYTGKTLDVNDFDLDHFVPYSFVSNDELWNLTPMSKELNSSKGNRLPDKRFIQEFAKYNFVLYDAIFNNNKNSDQARNLMAQFDRCTNHHLNATWAANKLYIPNQNPESFIGLLEENLVIVYESACLQEYEMWEM